ncbi:MAG: hypothetical protein DI558_13230 [Corynebacterium propinquum]|nr:MAG: hypothetical protein DI558_13230 [Corynebacterium propinquum]
MTSTTAIAIAADMSKLQALLENEDGAGLSPEMIADTMEGLELQLGDKLDAVFVHVRNLEGLAKTCDEEAKRLAARKKSFEGKITNLKKYELLPDELVTVQTLVTPDKKAIKEAIESAQAAAAQITADGGEIPEELLNPVPGAHLEIGERSLQVR